MINYGIEEIFPTPLFYANADNETLEETNKLVSEFLQSDDWKQTPTHPLAYTQTTYHSHTDFLGRVGADKLKNFIAEAAYTFADILNIKIEPMIIQSWLNVNPPGHFTATHKHYGAMIVGVFYLKFPKNSGALIIEDPVDARQQAMMYHDVNTFSKYNYEIYSYTEQPSGRLIMFESWLAHKVEVNNSNEDRICIAFNISNKVK
jgi:uncharacterized protein (TIGR02466 family)